MTALKHLSKVTLALMAVVFFFACSPVESTKGRGHSDRYRGVERRGDIGTDEDGDESETISDSPQGIEDRVQKALKNAWSKINKCKSSTHGVPRSTTDLVTNMFGIQSSWTSQLRECLSQSLENASNTICQSYRQLEEMLQKSRGYDVRTERVEAALERVERMEYRYKDNLDRMSQKMHDLANRHDGRGGLNHFLVADEAWAYASILDQEIETNCENYSDRSYRSSRRY